jgi:hypothetical protein
MDSAINEGQDEFSVSADDRDLGFKSLKVGQRVF